MTALLPPINRARFARIVGVAALCATAAAAALSSSGDEGTPTVAFTVAGMMLVCAGMAVFALLPALIKDDIWGLAVLGITAAQTMFAAGAMLVLIEAAGLPRVPVVYGLTVGVLVLILAEAIAAVWQLQHREAARASTAQTDNRAGGVQPARRSL